MWGAQERQDAAYVQRVGRPKRQKYRANRGTPKGGTALATHGDMLRRLWILKNLLATNQVGKHTKEKQL